MSSARRAFSFVVVLVVLAAGAYGGWQWWQKRGEAPAPAGTEAHEVLDVGERSLDGKPALAVIFATELDPRHDYDGHLEVFRIKDKESQEVSGAWVMSEDRHLLYFPDIEPEVEYEVRITADLPDAAGQTLGEAQQRKVTTRKVTPAFGFASTGSVLPSRVAEGLPIVTVNIPEVAVEFLRVKEDSLAQFVNTYSWQYGRTRTATGTLNDMAQFTESVYYGRFTIKAEANARTVTQIPVNSIDKLREPGLYIAVMSQPGHYDWQLETSYFVISDIGLQARRYAKHLEVYASSLASGDPLDDVELQVLDNKGKRLAEAETDRKGHARLDITLKSEQVLVARRGKDLSLLAFNQPALDLSGYHAEGPTQGAREVFIYGPRDLYRPGETVDVAMLLRDSDGRAVPNQPLTAKLNRPDGKTVRNLTLEPEQLGFYRTNLDIPGDAPVGQWSLLVYTDPASKEPARSYPFKVEEFLPERMKLTLDSPQPHITPGEPYKVDIQGDYLYGAPAAGNKVTAVLNVRPEPHPLPELEDYHFGDVNESNERKREELPALNLDDAGHAQLDLKVADEVTNSPLAARVTVNLFETGGRPVVRSLTRHVWPAEALVGIHPLFENDTSPSDGVAEFEVLRVNAEGKALPAKGLLVKLIREEREYYWNYDDESGWQEQFSEANLTVHTGTVTLSGDKPAKLSVPVDYGRYRLDVYDPHTQRNARYRFYAGWGERDDQTGPDRVLVKLDKAAYKAGDTVELQILPPHAGSAQILVESDRVLWQDRTHVRAGGKTVKFKVGEDWNRHDIYVSVTVFRPGSRDDHITPNRAVGLIHLPLERADRQIKPEIVSVTRMRPSQPLDVKVKLGAAAGKTAFVTVAAVDVGVLNITNFETPDPFDYFFQQHRFGVDVYDLYGKVIETVEGRRARLRFGGDEDVSADRSKLGRAEVQIVSLFSGAVQVGPEGMAEVKLDIPDFNGTLRLMTVAYTEDQFGSAESEVIVAAPVIAEAATPRFLAPGDKSSVTLDLHNMSGAAQTLGVKLSADGPLAVRDSQSVSLADGKRTTLKLPLTADEAYGVGSIRLEVSGKDIDINRRWELGVRPAFPGDRRMQLRMLKPGETLRLESALADGLMPATVDGSVVLSSQAPLNVRDAVKHLLGYPYGCAEQTTSQAFPLIYVDEAKAKQIGIDPLKPEDRTKRIEMALGRIAGFQTPSGGFTVWPGGDEDPWITPYLTDFLMQARDQGYAVNDAMLKKAQDRLLARVQSGSDVNEERWSEAPAHLGFSTKSYASYVLARVQRAPLGTLRTLYDNHGKAAESGLPLVQLGLALALQGDKEKGLAAIKAGLEKTYPQDKYLGDYGSDVRDNALMLALLVRHADAIGELGTEREALILRLSNAMRGRNYFSTQEQFAIFLAAEALESQQPKAWQAEVTGIGGKRSEGVERRLVLPFTMADLRAGLSVTPKSDFPIYAVIDLAGYPKQAPKPRLDPIKITRGYYGMDGKAIGNRPLKVGEMVLVYLQMESKARIEDALITDLVPAGLEVENLNIAQGETLEDVMIDGVRPAEAMNAWPVKYQEYRDDRYVAALYLDQYGPRRLYYIARVVSPGTFHVPPPFVEDMYRPEIFGIGETPGMLEVRE